VREYCAYSHFSAMLDRAGEDWLIAVIDLEPDDYELYFDDSGSGSSSPVAVAACYIATKRQWDESRGTGTRRKWKKGSNFST
jgi:hypothetical protein